MSAVIAFSLTCLAIVLSALIGRSLPTGRPLPLVAGTWDLVMVALLSGQENRPVGESTDAVTLGLSTTLPLFFLLRRKGTRGLPPDDCPPIESHDWCTLPTVHRSAEWGMSLPHLRGGGEEKQLVWRGSGARLEEEELHAVIAGFDPQTRQRLRRVASELGFDEVSTLVWLSERTSGPLTRRSV